MNMSRDLSFTVTALKYYDEAFVVIGSESGAAWEKTAGAIRVDS